MNKKTLLSAFLTAIMVGGLILASTIHFGTVQASTDISGIPKPSVPEFTVSQVDRSYDVPVTTTYSTDPFTGQQITRRSGGYHVENKTIDITIRKQQLAPIDLGNGSVIQLYYSVRTKGHFGDWNEASSTNGYTFKRGLASTSDYTVVTLILGSENDILLGKAELDVPVGGQEDFQVKAEAGYLYPHYQGLVQTGTYFASFGESSWSSTQTLTIGESQTPTSSPATTPTPTPSITPYQEPQQTEQEIIMGAAIATAVIVAGLGLLIYLIKRK